MPKANQTNREGGETARVLLYDIETSPNLAWIWGKYEQDAIGDLVKEREMLCFAWRWLGENETHALALPMLKSYRKGGENRKAHKALAQGLHALFCEADIVVGHNVTNFDDKMANTEFICHGLPPPPPHKVIDTLKIARSRFRFNSNRLDDLGQRLGLGRKVKHRGFNMWLGCLNGEKRAWAEMTKYCMGDVVLLEKIYLAFRPWMTNHPQVTTNACPYCGGKNLRPNGSAYRKSGKVPRFRCDDCGAFPTGTVKREGIQFRS